MHNRTVNRLFIISMWWRISYGALRIVTGLTLLQYVHRPLYDLVAQLMRTELIEDPADTLVFTVVTYLQHHSLQITYFAAVYFLFWGVIDIVLSLCLLKHQLWAFPLSLSLIVSFMVYEISRFLHTGSWLLILLLAVDSFVFWIIYREYRFLKRSAHQAEPRDLVGAPH